MSFVWLLLVNGVVLGATYALLSAGLSLIFGVLNVVNFAHGALYMLGAFAAVITIPKFGYLGGIIAACVILGLVGVLLQDGIFRWIPPDEGFSRSLLVTIGLTMIIQSGAILIWGARTRTVPSESSPKGSIELLGATLPVARGYIVLVAAVALTALYLILNRSQLGRAMRGVAQNRLAALVVGIPRPRVERYAMTIGVALAGLAGAVLAPVYSASPQMGIEILFKVFAIVVIGGLASVPGAVVTAMGVGVLESFAGGYGSTVIQNGAVFAAMIIIMVIRPQGLFGRQVRVA